MKSKICSLSDSDWVSTEEFKTSHNSSGLTEMQDANGNAIFKPMDLYKTKKE